MSVIGAVGCLMLVKSTPNTPQTMHKRLGFTLAHAGLMGMSLGPLLQTVSYIDPTIIPIALVGTTAVFACFSAAAVVAPRRYYMFLGGMLGCISCAATWILCIVCSIVARVTGQKHIDLSARLYPYADTGILGSLLSVMMLFSLLSMFMRVEAIMLGQLYLGLAVFCGYVVYDTQVILEKARAGVQDPISDSLQVRGRWCRVRDWGPGADSKRFIHLQLFTDFFGILVRVIIILARNAQKKEQRRDERRGRR